MIQRSGAHALGSVRRTSAASQALQAPVRDRVGRHLVANGIITDGQRSEALSVQRREGGVFGQILVRMGACSREDVGGALATQKTLTSIDLGQVEVDPEALKLITREGCLENGIVPFERFGSLLCLAMARPQNRSTVLIVKNATEMPVKPFKAAWDDIQSVIDTHYNG